MRVLLVFAVALTGLAGCLDSDPAETTTPPPEPSGHPVWVTNGEGVVLDASAFPGAPAFEQIHVTDRISGEPTVGVTRSGAVFYPAIEFDSGVPGAQTLPTTDYYRSLDGGRTWSVHNPHVLQLVDAHAYSFDPYVYVDPSTGRVYAMDMGPHVACNKVSWSDNDGNTWLTREGACPLPVSDHPSIAAGPKVGPLGVVPGGAGGYPNNVYLCSNQVADVQCSLSPDGGLNWLPSQPVFTGVDLDALVDDPASVQWLCGSLTGHVHASFADGTVYLGRGYCGVPMVGVSRDGGLNWEAVAISTDPDHFLLYEHDVSVGTDLSGNVYALWLGRNDTRVFLSVSTDQGRSWGEPMDVTAPGVTAVKLPSLVGGSEGRIAFQYVGTTTPSGWDIHDFEDGNETLRGEYLNATWNAYVGIGLDAAGSPVFVTTTVNDIAEPLKRGGCWDRCFGNVGGMYDFLDIDIDPRNGQIWTALVDVCTNECDHPGATAEAYQRAFGTVGKQVAGPRLLDAPFPAR